MWFLALALSPYPTFSLLFPHCLFLSQCKEEDVSHHAHPIWEDPPLLQRSCECLSLSMATHDCPSPSSLHTQVSKAFLPLLPHSYERSNSMYCGNINIYHTFMLQIQQEKSDTSQEGTEHHTTIAALPWMSNKNETFIFTCSDKYVEKKWAEVESSVLSCMRFSVSVTYFNMMLTS